MKYIKFQFGNFLENIFLLFFREKMGDKVRVFIKNFGYIAWAEILGSLIGFPVKILAGRYLGPEEYGKYSLILTLAQFFIIPMMLGFGTAALRYLPLHKDRQKEIIGVIKISFFFTLILSSIFFVFTKSWWMKIFGISEDLFWWTLIFSVILAIYNLYESFNRGMYKFKLFAYTTIINSTILLFVFLIFLFLFNVRTYQAFIVASVCAMLISLSVLVYSVVKNGFTFFLSKDLSMEILKYSGIAVFGGITGFLIGSSDRFFINNYISLYWVGVYSAYVNASNVFVGRFFQIFLNVYFPTVSGEIDKHKIDHLIKKIVKIFIPFVFLLSVFSIWGIIWLFGSRFPVRLDLIILFSINNCLYIFYQLYMWLLNSQGIRGSKTVIKILVINSVLNLILFYFLIQAFGVVGAIISTIIVNIIFGIYFYVKTKEFFMKDHFYEKAN